MSSALRRSNLIFIQKKNCDFLKTSGIFLDLWPHNRLDFILLYKGFGLVIIWRWFIFARRRLSKSVFLNSFVCQSITISDQCLSGWKGTILINTSTAVQKYNFRVNLWQELKLISRIGSPRGHPILELSPYIASNSGECVRCVVWETKGEGPEGSKPRQGRIPPVCIGLLPHWSFSFHACFTSTGRIYRQHWANVKDIKYRLHRLSTTKSVLLRFEERGALWAMLTC